MKKALFFIAGCMLIAACSNNYVLDGTISSSKILENNPATAVLMDPSSNSAVDSCEIVDGKFHFEGPAATDIMYSVAIAGPDGSARPLSIAKFVPEKGKISMDLGDEEITLTGSAINDALGSFLKESTALITSLRAADDENEADEIYKKYNALNLKLFEDNKDNILGLQGLKSIIYDLSSEEIEEKLQGVPEFITSDRTVAKVREAKLKEAATGEGKMFVDFEGKTPAGEPAKLSDFVGKGWYTLVDFWAPWCGPCKAEIPNVKALNDKYAGENFKVLGVAVWDYEGYSKEEVMEQLGMTWDEIFMGEDNSATDAYGIVGIPHIILFGPDGTVVKRNLRGEELTSTIASLFE